MPSLLRRVLLTLGVAALAVPYGIVAQQRTIVSKSVAASSSGATLQMEFADEGTLTVDFDGGSVLIDGERIGTYAAGDALDREWRRLLGEAMGLENGALADVLQDWTVPDVIEGSLALVAERIDEALEREISAVPTTAEGGSDFAVLDGDDSLGRILLSAVGRLGGIEAALEGIDGDVRVHVDENVRIQAGTEVDGTVVVMQGLLIVEGTIRGDAIVIGGTLDVPARGTIEGEARLVDSRVARDLGEIRGGITNVDDDGGENEETLRDRIRAEIRDEISSEIRNEIRDDLDDERQREARNERSGSSLMAPFRPIVRGVGGAFEKLVTVLILGLLGAGFLAFAGQNVDTISETARRAPGRSAMVGLAGSFLLIPVWIMGTLALVVSVIGIPVAIAWLPLFPLAALAAGLVGFVAVARNTGEWLADSEMPWTGWIRKSSPIVTLFGGLLGLFALLIAGHLVSIIPFFGAISVLLFVAGSFVSVVAIQIGFGAVLLTRAGRRKEYAGRYDPDAAWAAAMNMDAEFDLGADDETSGEGR